LLSYYIAVASENAAIISKIGKLQHLLLGKASVCYFHESIIAARRRRRRAADDGDEKKMEGGGLWGREDAPHNII